jgi:hypothetical protein
MILKLELNFGIDVNSNLHKSFEIYENLTLSDLKNVAGVVVVPATDQNHYDVNSQLNIYGTAYGVFDEEDDIYSKNLKSASNG